MAYSKTVKFAPPVTTGTTTISKSEYPYYTLDYDKTRNNYKKIVEEQQY